MLKKVVAVLLIMVFVITTMPLFAGKAQALSTKVKGFQVAYDSLDKSVGRKQGKPLWTLFQDSSNYIHRPVRNVKPLSLRNNKRELARRRGIR